MEPGPRLYEVSPGCKFCYAEVFAERFRGVPGHPFEQGFDLRLVPEKLDQPLHWRRDRRVNRLLRLDGWQMGCGYGSTNSELLTGSRNGSERRSLQRNSASSSGE